MTIMRSAGIREARQNLSALLEEVRKGREVVLTDRGRPVARLVPPEPTSQRAVSDHRQLRASIRLRGRPLSDTVADERGDRV
jgi:prevent-host-death family protein